MLLNLNKSSAHSLLNVVISKKCFHTKPILVYSFPMGQQLSSGIKFPYKKGHKVWEHSPNNEYSLSLFDGEDNNTSAPVSIFSIQPTQSQLASNYFKRIKTIKHPNLLSMINGTVVENEASYYIVTEKVRPLRNALKDLLTYPDSIAWGLYQISVCVILVLQYFSLI